MQCPACATRHSDQPPGRAGNQRTQEPTDCGCIHPAVSAIEPGRLPRGAPERCCCLGRSANCTRRGEPRRCSRVDCAHSSKGAEKSVFEVITAKPPTERKRFSTRAAAPLFLFFSLLRLFFLFFFLFSAWRTRSARATVSNTHLHASTNTTTITKNRRIQFAQTDRSSLGHGRLCCNSAAYAWFSADFNSSLRCPTSPLLIVDDIVDTAPETRTLHGSTQGLCGTSNPGREQQLEWSVRLQTDQARQIPRGS